MKIQEVTQTKLYHNTSLLGLIGMMNSGQIGKGGVSLTRDRHYKHTPGAGHTGQEERVRLVFDRDEIRSRYKMRPYVDRSVVSGRETLPQHRARWESEERVQGPISFNDVERIELPQKTVNKIHSTIASYQRQIEFAELRLEKLQDGEFWHQQRRQFLPIQTPGQERAHRDSAPSILNGISRMKKDIQVLDNVLNSSVEVEQHG